MSDEEVKDTLITWGFPDLIEPFRIAGIDQESFLLLDESSLQRVLNVGQYLKFIGVFKANTVDTGVPALKRRRLEISGDLVGNPSKTDVVMKPSAPGELAFLNSDDDATPLDSNANVNPDISLTETVKEILDSSLPGQILLRKCELEETDRNRLSEILIVHFMHKAMPKGELTKSFLVALSAAICEVYPDESKETFFTPYKRVAGVTFNAKGKLLHQFYHWRHKGVECKLFPRKTHATSPNPEDCDFLSNSDDEDSYNFVTLSLGPQDDALRHWGVTHNRRMRLLKHDPKYENIHVYFADFPVLRQPWGYALLTLDFSRLHKDCHPNLFLKWPEFAKKLVGMLVKKKQLSTDEAEYLRNTISVDGKQCQEVLIHIAKLFPVQVVLKGRKPNHWTANKSEMQQGFFHHVKTDAELETFISNRMNKLKGFPKPIPFQPICVVVGKSLKEISASYALVARERYKVDSPLQALDLAFKLVYALDLKYSPDAKAIWRFLQRAVFELRFDTDEPITCLPALLNMYAKC